MQTSLTGSKLGRSQLSGATLNTRAAIRPAAGRRRSALVTRAEKVETSAQRMPPAQPPVRRCEHRPAALEECVGDDLWQSRFLGWLPDTITSALQPGSSYPHTSSPLRHIYRIKAAQSAPFALCWVRLGCYQPCPPAAATRLHSRLPRPPQHCNSGCTLPPRTRPLPTCGSSNLFASCRWWALIWAQPTARPQVRHSLMRKCGMKQRSAGCSSNCSKVGNRGCNALGIRLYEKDRHTA